VVHVPYQSAAQATLETVANRVQITPSTITVLKPYVASMGGSGKLRVLAVSSAERSPLAPDVPGMREAGFDDIDFSLWGGYMGPAGMPRSVVDKLNQAINLALNDPKVVETFRGLGLVGLPGPPEKLAQVIQQDYDAYTRLIRDTGIKLE
jgi:tripartite-type tricarboxylate transporter receptor subunit TctC